jgi:transposase
MKLHARAGLTIKQRQEVKRLHEEDGVSIRALAGRFGVQSRTILKWVKRDSPLDKSSARIKTNTVVTPEYRDAVIAYRNRFPAHGPIRIAQELESEFPWANRGTILTILQEEGLTRPPKKEKKPRNKIRVGRHRIQMDIQQLPAVKGGQGFEYKITAIHLSTRFKYSEIHSDRKSETVAGVLLRALDLMPPFFFSLD